MKRILCSIALAVSVVGAFSQGTIYFTANLTGNYGVDGTGSFSLSSNLFRYDVETPFPMSVAQMRSPWPDTNAASVFDLTWVGCDTPSAPTNNGGCFFHGSLVLSDAQVADLSSGNWFVYAPNGPFFVQGQVVSTPEPAPLALFGLGAGFLCFRHRQRARKSTCAKSGRSLLPIAVVALVLGVANASSQGTLYFSAQMTGTSGVGGDASFSLTTNYLTYSVVITPFVSDPIIQIRSPWPDTNATAIFTLHPASCSPPLAPYPGECDSLGHLVLSNQQVSDLESGNWYAYACFGGPSPCPFSIQGQILGVPEPRAMHLIGMALVAMWLFRRYGASRPQGWP
jgi:hypothetical protein